MEITGTVNTLGKTGQITEGTKGLKLAHCFVAFSGEHLVPCGSWPCPCASTGMCWDGEKVSGVLWWHS